VGFLASLFGKKNPLKSINVNDLKISEIQLKKKIEDIHAEIQRLENEEKRLIEKGQATGSVAEKKSLSGQITYVREQKSAKLSTQLQIQSQLRSVSNLIIIKEQWKDLPEKVRKTLMDTPPEKMEDYLIEMVFESKSAADQRKTIIQSTSDILDVESDEDTDGILPELMSPEHTPAMTNSDTKQRREFE
jgi:hypothetical protein